MGRLGRLSVLPALAALLLGGQLPQVAHAQEDWRASAFKGWTVTALSIRGLENKFASELKGGLALARATGFLGARRPVFFPQTLNEDLMRCELFLAQRGFPYARITPRFDPNRRREELTLILDVEPGPAVTIASTPLRGIPPELEEDAQSILSAGLGSVFVDKDVERTVSALDSMLTYSGYARAKVHSTVRWQDTTRVDVHFDLNPGSRYHFGEVTVSGAREDLEPLVRKTASIRRGERYSPKTLEDSQKYLRLLGLFRQIRFELQDAAPDTVDVAIEVVMREPRRFETNARYWTDDGFSAGARWTHRNLLRKGRGVSVTILGSVLRQLSQISAWWPAVLWPRSRGVLSVGSERENEDAYESVSTGVELALRHDYSERTTLRLSASLTEEQITNKSTEPEAIPDADGRLLAFNLGWDRDGGNHPVVPTSGTLTNGYLEWSPLGQISETSYVLGEATGVIYARISARTSLAARVSLGLGTPLGETAGILPNKLFHSGGANSMRGFERRKLGPLDAQGAPLGGETKFEASIEYRFPLTRRFRGTLFIDSGQVWSKGLDLEARKFEVAVGPGLWFDTVIGPIRGDVGYRITDYEKSEPRTVFHFSIGPAF